MSEHILGLINKVNNYILNVDEEQVSYWEITLKCWAKIRGRFINDQNKDKIIAEEEKVNSLDTLLNETKHI